jgi:hypothetical protein
MKLKGFVEVHGPNAVSGWCIRPSDSGVSTPVSLSIWWNDLKLRTVRADIPRADIARGSGVAHSGFRFGVSAELRALLPCGTRLLVADEEGNQLPFLNPQVAPIGEAVDQGESLIKKIELGHVIDKWGKLKLPFSVMSTAHRQSYARSMERLSEHFHSRFGLALFPHYGTLLGLAREGQFLGHDDDVDMSYATDSNSLEHVADRFFDIAEDLRKSGHSVQIVSAGQMNVGLPDAPRSGVDIFSTWVTTGGEFFTYFGVGGRVDRPLRFQRMMLEGISVLVPENYEHILEMTYGPSWRIPDESFQWRTPPSLVGRMNALKALGHGRS